VLRTGTGDPSFVCVGWWGGRTREETKFFVGRYKREGKVSSNSKQRIIGIGELGVVASCIAPRETLETSLRTDTSLGKGIEAGLRVPRVDAVFRDNEQSKRGKNCQLLKKAKKRKQAGQNVDVLQTGQLPKGRDEGKGGEKFLRLILPPTGELDERDLRRVHRVGNKKINLRRGGRFEQSYFRPEYVTGSRFEATQPQHWDGGRGAAVGK